MEGVRCFLCANGSPVEPRLHYIQVMATDTAHTTDYCRLSASELKTRVASWQERTLEGFLEAVGLKLGLQARRCFTRHGGEVEDVALVMHNEVLFLSAGEEFLPCRQGDAESLSYACQLMLEEELLHRRLVAQSQAAGSSALQPPAQAPREGRPPRSANETVLSLGRAHREQPTSPEQQWDAARPGETRLASSLARTVSFGLSAVDGGVGEPDDGWGPDSGSLERRTACGGSCPSAGGRATSQHAGPGRQQTTRSVEPGAGAGARTRAGARRQRETERDRERDTGGAGC